MRPFAIITDNGQKLILNADKIVSISECADGTSIEIEGWPSQLRVQYKIEEIYSMLTMLTEMYIYPEFIRQKNEP